MDIALCAMDGAADDLIAMGAYDAEMHFCFQELLSRTSLETQKLDLMTEVSELKLKLVGMAAPLFLNSDAQLLLGSQMLQPSTEACHSISTEACHSFLFQTCVPLLLSE